MEDTTTITPGYIRRLLRHGRLVVRGVIDKKHPADAEIIVLGSDIGGTRAGAIGFTWEAQSTPRLHRGSDPLGISSDVIDLTTSDCFDPLGNIIASFGRAHPEWLREDVVLWVVMNSNTLQEIGDDRGPASAFALMQIAAYRTALATVQLASFGALSGDWRDVLSGIRQRSVGLHVGAATLRVESVGV